MNATLGGMAVLRDPALAGDALVNQGFLVRLKVGYQGFLLGYEAVDFGATGVEE